MKLSVKLFVIDVGSVIAVIVMLAYLDAPWWAYLVMLTFGTAQRITGRHMK